MEKIDKMIVNIHTSSLAAILTAFLPPSSFLLREEGGREGAGGRGGGKGTPYPPFFLGRQKVASGERCRRHCCDRNGCTKLFEISI